MRTLLAALLVLACAPCSGHDGRYDAAFGTFSPGHSVFDVVPDPDISTDTATGLVALDDGRLVVAAYSLHGLTGPRAISVLGLDAGGSLDPTFGTAGITLIAPPAGLEMQRTDALLRARDGDLWAIGTASAPQGPVARLACRMSASGIVQGTFGEAGCVRLSAPDGFAWTLSSPYASLDAQDRLVVLASGASGAHRLIVSRWQADGRPDTTFGHAGAVVLSGVDALAGEQTHSLASGLALDTQGRIVIAGKVYARDLTGFDATVFARLAPDGSLDPAFGDAGLQVVADGLHVTTRALVTDPTDGVVACGSRTISTAGPNPDSDVAIIRLGADGRPRAGFGTAGLRTFAFDPAHPTRDECNALTLQPDGRLVVAGAVESAPVATGYDLALARLWPDGRLDTSFGPQGSGILVEALDLSPQNPFERFGAIAWSNQTLVAAGQVGLAYNQDDVLVVRLHADGVFAHGFDGR